MTMASFMASWVMLFTSFLMLASERSPLVPASETLSRQHIVHLAQVQVSSQISVDPYC